MTNDCPVLAGPDDETEIVKDKQTDRDCKLSAEACANMRLMAAAPELLDTLETVRTALNGLSNFIFTCKVIDAVIAKATGKTSQ